jgi:hypothetical protein
MAGASSVAISAPPRAASIGADLLNPSPALWPDGGLQAAIPNAATPNSIAAASVRFMGFLPVSSARIYRSDFAENKEARATG